MPGWPSADRFAVRTIGVGMTDPKTYIFKVPPNNPVPAGMDKMTDLDQFAKASGARILPHGNDVALAPNSDAYVYSRPEAQRNLYRIPLPR